MGADFRDFDKDGMEDIFVTALTNERFSLYRNLGRGKFLDAGALAAISAGTFPFSGWSSGMFDFNNDGFKDLFAVNGNFDLDGRIDAVVTRRNEAPLVLRNTSARAGHWIAVRLIGTHSKRDGLGARVRLVAPSGTQWNRATTSVGYAGSSDRIVHFGLGEDTRASLAEIEWPSGTSQQLRDVAAGQYMQVREPE
jgi:hypothetical protein